MPARPIRVKFKNELGISTTLPAGEQYLRLLGSGEDILVLCPGPEPELCVPLLSGARRILVLREPEFERRMPPAWPGAFPPDWEPVSMEAAPALLPEARVLHYTPATRLLPSIYAPLLAALHPAPKARRSAELWMPCPEKGLIIPELEDAALALGLRPRRLPAGLQPVELATMLEAEAPGLFLSVNFHGLDPWGENQSLLEAAGVPVAVWCVDNPFHLLTGQKTLLWKRLPLFVTDDWFVGPLRSMGADARHLPLAVSPKFFAPGAACPTGRDLTFVGRSSFPDRDRFFAACRVPDGLAAEAGNLSGKQAHFGWWRDRLPDIPLWPGNDVRILGLGAETASAAWRRNCLIALNAVTDLTVIGDDAWRSLMPGVRLLPPVDYYSGLSDVCRRASFTLNLTSLLLPHGLTQRHFDVWACGGFLLTDDTPGLSIFPAELTRPVAFETPGQAADLLAALAAAPKRKEELRRSWQEHVLSEHTYTRRLNAILDTLRA
ncbi:glycosyltransferase family protein [Desulfomicrobium escambiense]|uniref:glycosyltransferase family protein n=1 Tax=Desulfomicrobium escambiense TaxID=29503 RepID=UPI00041B58E0|nr:glycosyltransferase [Desulfomicrobium escambiense]